jgi:hypothetical protein
MLIGNYSVLAKTPGRFIGGGAIGLGMNRGDRNKSSMARGAFCSLAWEEKSGVPDGYRPPSTWVIPLKSGGLAARNNLIGAGDTDDLNLAGGVNGESPLTGSGDLTGTAQLIISMVGALTGSGDITSAAILAILGLAADLAGAGDIAGALTALGNAIAALTGAGDVTVTINAEGELEAAIVVTGDALSTANVADAILDAANGVETGLTLRQALRVIAAATAGKVSGAETTTITFRNALVDDTDRIVATVDVDGNRTAVTLDTD